MRKTIFLVFSVLAALAVVALPVQAITYGVSDGGKHPEVGGLVVTYKGQLYLICSGTLVSPTVFVTAAHCNPGTDLPAYVTFDEQFDDATAKVYPGTYIANPLYTWSQDDPHDLAVFILNKPVKGIAPAQLPKAGSLGDLPKDQKFTAVGYGGQYPVNQPGGPVIAYLDSRQYAVSSLNAVNPAWLRLSQNPATGNGGTCYGDSGGPNFLGSGAGETNVLAATTITGDMLCKASNVVYRLDTPAARDFLGQFVALP